MAVCHMLENVYLLFVCGVIREQAQIMKKTGMKRVLLLGSGYVSGPVIEYLTRDPGTQVTVGMEIWTTIVKACRLIFVRTL